MKRPDAYKVYLFLSFTSGILFAASFGTPFYETITARLTPLQLVLVGTARQLSMLLFEVPTGVVADMVSRRLSVILGHTLMGLGLVAESLFPSFIPILLAQVVWAVGYTFTSGATEAWLSDEIGEERANRAFLTANRYDLSGNVVGVLAATALGSFTSVSVTLFATGAARVLLAVLLVFLMSEHGFKPTRPKVRHTLLHMTDTFRKGVHTIRLRPILLAILGIGLFYGTIGGFDRLWVKHLTDRFELPVLFGNNELGFFGLLELASILLAIILTQQIEKRFDASRPRVVGRLMLVITAGIAVSIAGFACSPFLWLALALYLVIYSFQELTDPLLVAWMNQRLDPDVRATILSMTAQAGAIGQVIGSLTVGVLANVFSVPLALFFCGGLLTPALGFIIRANRHAHAQLPPETAPTEAPPNAD
jgi:DHA3 family tetracycline resistance protein-like MFS transporter